MISVNRIRPPQDLVLSERLIHWKPDLQPVPPGKLVLGTDFTLTAHHHVLALPLLWPISGSAPKAGHDRAGSCTMQLAFGLHRGISPPPQIHRTRSLGNIEFKRSWINLKQPRAETVTHWNHWWAHHRESAMVKFNRRGQSRVSSATGICSEILAVATGSLLSVLWANKSPQGGAVAVLSLCSGTEGRRRMRVRFPPAQWCSHQ